MTGLGEVGLCEYLSSLPAGLGEVGLCERLSSLPAGLGEVEEGTMAHHIEESDGNESRYFNHEPSRAPRKSPKVRVA